MKRVAIALLVTLSIPAPAAEMRAQLSARSPRSRAGSVSPLVGYGFTLTGPLSADIAARLALLPTAVQSADYQAELRLDIVGGFSAAVRLLQVNRIEDGLAFTQVSGRLDGVLAPFAFLEFYGAAGWHERFVSLKAGAPLPFLSGISFRDRDFALRAGCTVIPTQTWRGSFGIGTIEEMDVHNLNSPFFETSVEYRPGGGWSILALARYRILLGFGRLAEWQGLVGLKWDLNRLGAFGS